MRSNLKVVGSRTPDSLPPTPYLRAVGWDGRQSSCRLLGVMDGRQIYPLVPSPELRLEYISLNTRVSTKGGRLQAWFITAATCSRLFLVDSYSNTQSQANTPRVLSGYYRVPTSRPQGGVGDTPWPCGALHPGRHAVVQEHFSIGRKARTPKA